MPAPLAARAALLSLVACLALALAAPALAAAASFEVDTTVDLPDVELGVGGCETEMGTCSLRAAIEEINLVAQESNSIGFDDSVFDGEETDTVFLASQLPALVSRVTIEAGSCMTAGVAGGPCAGVTGTDVDPVFVIEADDVEISGLSVANGSIGIGVFGESTGFRATGNWIGVSMAGTNADNSTGVFIGPGSDEAVVGGRGSGDRNVIAWNEVGLDIEGASKAIVRGNWFGVTPEGNEPGPAATNIEITDYEPADPLDADKAENNEVGAVIEGTAKTSAECDDGCNVISAAVGDGIDLEGDGAAESEAAASGPTRIRGNYVGLNPAGTAAVVVGFVLPNYEGNRIAGIKAGGAGGVTVGGDRGSESNLLAGGAIGISSEGGEGFVARTNSIGFAADGEDATPPTDQGLLVSSDGVLDGASIEENAVRLDDEEGTGIEHHFAGATISGNLLVGGEIGIASGEYSAPSGSLIEDNQVIGSDDAGILLYTPDNEVFGNTVSGVDTGIEVSPDPDVEPGPGENVSGNVIGGDTADSENIVDGSGGFAIIIRGIEASRNEVRRNRGSGNEGDGPFIVLRPFKESEGDTNGVGSPVIASAAKTEASGTGAPGATVRVFWKASSEEGEIAGFLGQATVDVNGNWKATYAPQPEGTRVVATQTLGGGTSDLSSVKTTPPDPPAPPSGCPAVPSPCPPAPPTPPTPDTTKPKVTIKKAPKAKSTATTAKFVFSSDEAGSKFKCKLDNKAFANCKSPKTYKNLKPGKHTFKVKATDTAGNFSAVMTRTFTVLE